MMIDPRIKEWEKLKYISPIRVLPKLRELQIQLVEQKLDEKIRNLRTSRLKHHLEKRTAAIFCFGMSCVLGKGISFAPAPMPDLDYDAIAKYQDNDEINYVQLQIKEVVPESLSPSTDLNKEIQKLIKRYPVSRELVVVIHYNRSGKFRLSDIKIPKLNITGLWILASCMPDQSRWFIAGNLLEDPRFYEFDYPSKDLLERAGITL